MIPYAWRNRVSAVAAAYVAGTAYGLILILLRRKSVRDPAPHLTEATVPNQEHYVMTSYQYRAPHERVRRLATSWLRGEFRGSWRESGRPVSCRMLLFAADGKPDLFTPRGDPDLDWSANVAAGATVRSVDDDREE